MIATMIITVLKNYMCTYSIFVHERWYLYSRNFLYLIILYMYIYVPSNAYMQHAHLGCTQALSD